jgi:hypothetical protein
MPRSVRVVFTDNPVIILQKKLSPFSLAVFIHLQMQKCLTVTRLLSKKISKRGRREHQAQAALEQSEGEVAESSYPRHGHRRPPLRARPLSGPALPPPLPRVQAGPRPRRAAEPQEEGPALHAQGGDPGPRRLPGRRGGGVRRGVPARRREGRGGFLLGEARPGPVSSTHASR